LATAIKVEHRSHAFAQRGEPLQVLDDVSITVPPESFVSLVGPSGCGKSTILRILSGLLVQRSGAAHIGTQSTSGRPGLAAFMPQKDLLLPWRRALDNAILGAEIAGVSKSEAKAQAVELLPRFGLSGFERSWPSQLSGGMRQRLALLRTFLQPADVLLLDEPFGALDAITRREMQQWLQGVWLQDRRTVLLVTHDVDEALVLSDEVLVMSRRPGRIVKCLAVTAERPRPPGLVTEPQFVAWKAELLAALDM
jgi:ABC-type nitrate/sulfonate/bicarbonate transport system ATPase subunit